MNLGFAQHLAHRFAHEHWTKVTTFSICTKQVLCFPAAVLTPRGGCTEPHPHSASSPPSRPPPAPPSTPYTPSPGPGPTSSDTSHMGRCLARAAWEPSRRVSVAPEGGSMGQAVSGSSLRHGRGPSLSHLNPPQQRHKRILGDGAEGGPPRVSQQPQEWGAFPAASVTSHRVPDPVPQHRLCACALPVPVSPGTASPSCPSSRAGAGAGGRVLCRRGRKWALPHEEPERQHITPPPAFARPPATECPQSQARPRGIDGRERTRGVRRLRAVAPGGWLGAGEERVHRLDGARHQVLVGGRATTNGCQWGRAVTRVVGPLSREAWKGGDGGGWCSEREVKGQHGCAGGGPPWGAFLHPRTESGARPGEAEQRGRG